MNSDVRFYLALIVKRLPVMLTIFVLCAGVGGGLAVTLPSRYVADARLLVESAQIPDNLAQSTVQTGAAEQLQIIEQRLMTRANLIDMANRYGVFSGDGLLSPDEIVKQMRDLTKLTTTSGRNQATLMTISFRAKSPQTAAGVVNELVTLVLNQDAERRRRLASQTLDYFEQEVQRLSGELGKRSAAIVAFKEANKDALPDGLTYRLDRQTQLQERINLAARDRVSLNEQRNRLIAVGAAGGGATVQLSPMQQQLQTLKGQLEAALSVYSETNPKVKMLKAQVAALEAQASKQSSSGDQTAASADPSKTMLDLQIAEIDSRIAFIDKDVKSAEDELASLRVAIEKTPENAIKLEALQRDYNNVQSQYEQATASLAKAQTGERIEVLSKGEKVSVIEQAVPPTEPNSPNRPMIAGGGLFLGTALAVAFFVLTEVLNRSIRRPVDLTRALGVQPLVTIPYLESETMVRRRRAMATIVIAGAAIGIPLALWATHTFYMPLDLLAEKAMTRLGL